MFLDIFDLNSNGIFLVPQRFCMKCEGKGKATDEGYPRSPTRIIDEMKGDGISPELIKTGEIPDWGRDVTRASKCSLLHRSNFKNTYQFAQFKGHLEHFVGTVLNVLAAF